MTRILRIKIDVTKIDKTRLFKGAKGTYLDATVFLNDEKGQYGDNGMITQDVSQEEREAGTRGEILGNATIVKVMDDNSPARHASGNIAPTNPACAPQANEMPEGDDIPF